MLALGNIFLLHLYKLALLFLQPFLDPCFFFLGLLITEQHLAVIFIQ